MLARFAAFIVWASVAASAVFWALRLFVQAPAAPPHSSAVATGAGAVRGDLTRLLGAAPVTPAPAVLPPEAASRFRLFGVMAPKPAKATTAAPVAGQGVALISLDGKPPKAYAVGARVDNDLVLQSVSSRAANIGPAQGTASVRLELPPPAPAATGRPQALVPQPSVAGGALGDAAGPQRLQVPAAGEAVQPAGSPTRPRGPVGPISPRADAASRR